MKKITAICFFISLFPGIYPANLTIGGVSFAQAYKDLPVFEVTVENAVSKITTTLYIAAADERRARENVILNGWNVTGVKRLTEKEKKEINLSAAGLGAASDPAAYSLESAADKTPPPDPGAAVEGAGIGIEKPYGYPSGDLGIDPYSQSGSAKLPDGTESAGESLVPYFENKLPQISAKDGSSAGKAENNIPGMKNAEDNLGLLPDSPLLEYVSSVNFDLGSPIPKDNPPFADMFKYIDKTREYIVFGHADEVVVSKNAKYKNNYTLSYLRAEEVKKIMIENGMPAENIKAVGLGVRYPLENSGSGSLANRRAEIYKFK